MSLDLYSLHATPEAGEYIIQKFDTDYHCESVYALSETTCMCPQGHKPTCRHRTMLAMFLKHGHIGDGWFLEWNTRLWRKPVNDLEPSKSMTQSLADDRVMGTSDSAGEPTPPQALKVAENPSSLPPPTPPEGSQPPQAAVAAPASPVEAGAPIVRRRKPGV